MSERKNKKDELVMLWLVLGSFVCVYVNVFAFFHYLKSLPWVCGKNLSIAPPCPLLKAWPCQLEMVAPGPVFI